MRRMKILGVHTKTDLDRQALSSVVGAFDKEDVPLMHPVSEVSEWTSQQPSLSKQQQTPFSEHPFLMLFSRMIGVNLEKPSVQADVADVRQAFNYRA